VFGAFGKSAAFKPPISIKINGFTHEEAGFVNYELLVK
jgi:hypothetical protein